MSLEKFREPGQIPKVVATVFHMAGIAVANASSTVCIALVMLLGGFVCTRVVAHYQLFDAFFHRLHWTVDITC
jgi:hypothetical protein